MTTPGISARPLATLERQRQRKGRSKGAGRYVAGPQVSRTAWRRIMVTDEDLPHPVKPVHKILSQSPLGNASSPSPPLLWAEATGHSFKELLHFLISPE